MHANVNMCDLWHTRKKAALRPHFPRPCGQLLWLCQTSFLFNLKHGRLRGCAFPAPTKVFPSVIKVKDKIGSWEESWSSGRHYGCQEQLLLWCLLQKMSFNPSRCYLSSISGIRSLEDRKGSWCSGHPYGCQEPFLFLCPLQKMSFNQSRFQLSSISGVGSLEDRNGSKQESVI